MEKVLNSHVGRPQGKKAGAFDYNTKSNIDFGGFQDFQSHRAQSAYGFLHKFEGLEERKKEENTAKKCNFEASHNHKVEDQFKSEAKINYRNHFEKNERNLPFIRMKSALPPKSQMILGEKPPPETYTQTNYGTFFSAPASKPTPKRQLNYRQPQLKDFNIISNQPLSSGYQKNGNTGKIEEKGKISKDLWRFETYRPGINLKKQSRDVPDILPLRGEKLKVDIVSKRILNY